MKGLECLEGSVEIMKVEVKAVTSTASQFDAVISKQAPNMDVRQD
jgi:hypothetical protein